MRSFSFRDEWILGRAPRFIVVSSLLLKLVFAWLARDMHCHRDECSYLFIGHSLLPDNGTPFLEAFGLVWPPGQPLFIAQTR